MVRSRHFRRLRLLFSGKEGQAVIDYQEELDRYLERIGELAHNKEYARLRDLFLPMEPADIALLLEESGPELMPLLYRLLPKETAAEVFVELEPESQEMLINGFSNTELKEVLDELYLDHQHPVRHRPHPPSAGCAVCP